jgi:hypothetical protein
LPQDGPARPDQADRFGELGHGVVDEGFERLDGMADGGEPGGSGRSERSQVRRDDRSGGGRIGAVGAAIADGLEADAGDETVELGRGLTLAGVDAGVPLAGARVGRADDAARWMQGNRPRVPGSSGG